MARVTISFLETPVDQPLADQKPFNPTGPLPSHKTGRSMSIVFRPILAFIPFLFFLAPVPTMATLSFESSLYIAETYIDNLFYRANDKRQDFGTILGPNLFWQFQNSDVVLGAAYLGRLGVFINNPKANRTLHNMNLVLDVPFLNTLYKGLTFNIDETLQFTPQLDAFSGSGAQDTGTAFRSPGGNRTRPPDEGTPSLWEGGTQGVFTNRANALLNRAALTVGYSLTPRLNISISYRNQYRRFSSKEFQDSLSHIGTAAVAYQIREGTTITPSYLYREIHFIGDSTSTTSANRIRSHSTQLSLSHTFTPSIQGTLSGGVAWTSQQGAEEFIPVTGGGVIPQSVSERWKTRFIGSARISKTYRDGQVSLHAGQSIGGGGGLASQATRTRTITGRISHSMTRRLNGFGSAGYAQNDSLEGQAFNTTTYRIQAGLSYDILSWLSGNLNYSHIKQRSKGSAATDLVVNQVFLGITAFADPWVPIP